MTDEQNAQQQGQHEAEEERFTVTFSDAPPEAQQQAAQQQAEATPEGDANPADAEQKGDATPAQKSAAGEKNEPSATHKEENARIIGLQGEEQALEIKSIQKKLVAPPQKQTKKTTAAHPPINPVGDSGDIPRTLNTVTSQAEYEALREAQDRAAAKEGWL